MSRHRFVRNINISDELEDDALSDGGEEDMTPEQEEQFNIAVMKTRSIVGSEESSGIPDSDIKDAVWEYYFDVEKSVQWLLEEQLKRNAAKERKDTSSPHASPQSTLQPSYLAQNHLNSAKKLSLSALASSRSMGHAQNAPKSRLSHLAVNASQIPSRSINSPDGSSKPSDAKSGCTVPSKLSLLARTKCPQTSASSPIAPPSTFSLEPSKLALKVQKSRGQSANSQNPVRPLDGPSPEFLHLFHSQSSRVQAPPSSFARLLGAPLTSYNPSHDWGFSTSNVLSFSFNDPSPDDIIINARSVLAARERTKADASSLSHNQTSKAKQLSNSQTTSATTSRAASPAPGLSFKSKLTGSKDQGQIYSPNQQQIDLVSLNADGESDEFVDGEPTGMSLAREKVLTEARKALDGEETGKKAVSVIVIGHVDAGKSTTMGRLLYELGRVDEKRRVANERASEKIGKSSFSWAWELDGTAEERERGVTMDIGLQNFSTPHRHITVLDAPGHRDFIPNMISGASQADCALLVVDSSPGEFEAGFARGGQTKEHLLLVRSLGVSQVVIAVNKLDQVHWQKDRYDEIVELLCPFLIQSGFPERKSKFVPVGAITGVNLVHRPENQATGLGRWYHGPTLVDLLDELVPPIRSLDAPLRIPISNVFRGQTLMSSGLSVSGRVCSGVVQVGERLRVLPGDETTVVRLIEQDGESVQWAAVGSNVTLYLTSIDPIHLSIGTVLCSLTNLIPLATRFVAQVIIFDIEVPITAGVSVELFHHSRNVPATLSKLIAILDRTTSEIVKHNPRVLTKMVSAKVEIILRTTTLSGPSSKAQAIPLEIFKINKEMGRVLLRRGGETIAAGVVVDIL